MARIIFVPQYPTPNRYQSWWFWKFPQEFKKANFEVITLGETYINNMKIERGNSTLFSPINLSIEFELQQMKEYIQLELKNDDILFMADLSFPGSFCSMLYHKKPKKLFCFCHATSINKYDIFEQDKDSKFMIESGNAKLFNKIFVGSEYHKNKLKWANTVVTYLPEPDHIETFKNEKKIYNIISASRPGKQKVDSNLETIIENKFGSIIRKETITPEEYYKFLGQSKILFISSFEDTFGYQIIDAINNNCIPIARNDLAYPEIINKMYLYDNVNDAILIINEALKGNLLLPEIICKQQMENFYKNIIENIIEK